MNKNAFIIILSVVCMPLFSQTHVDALRYSQHGIGGTARSVAMGGAFGALGGDFSSLSINPAGVAVYRSSEFTFTPEIYIDNATTRYFGNEVSEGKTNFNFNNIGYVANFNFPGVVKSLSIGVGFNRLKNFHRNSVINGVNDFSSYGDYMAADANDFGFGTFTSALFFDSYVIDDYGNGFYELNSTPDGYFDQDGYFIPTEQKIIENEEGRLSERLFSIGLNLGDILFLGTTLGWHGVVYDWNQSWLEYDGSDSYFQYFDYQQSLKVRGNGYTAKIGAIVRPIPLLRLGVSYHLPVYYSLREEYSTSISSRYIDWQVYKPIDDNQNDIDYLESKYSVTSPSKLVTSMAFTFGSFLILSSDFEYLNYSKMRMNATDYSLDGENDNIRQIYSDAYNLKIGTEFRLASLYMRGGFGYFGSPYASSEENYDAFKLSYSGGIGYRDKNFFIDLTYNYMTYDERKVLYTVSIDGTVDAPTANFDNKSHRIMTTIGFRF